jgi:hypothetical protein
MDSVEVVSRLVIALCQPGVDFIDQSVAFVTVEVLAKNGCAMQELLFTDVRARSVGQDCISFGLLLVGHRRRSRDICSLRALT